jgi:hypothetical protein
MASAIDTMSAGPPEVILAAFYFLFVTALNNLFTPINEKEALPT